jgi:hypothetical protein
MLKSDLINPCTKVIALLLVLVGTIQAKETQGTGEVLTDLEDPVSLVETYMNYKKFIKKYQCNIQVNKDSRYCVKVEHAISVREDNKSYIYATENGFALDEKNQRQEGHAGGGYVKLFKFQFMGEHKVKLVAKSDSIVCGSFGYPCQDNFYKIGAGPEMGWVLNTGFMNQGIMDNYIMIYALVNSKIDQVLGTPIEHNNSNTVGFLSDKKYDGVFTKITTVPTSTGRFSDLDAWVTSTKPKSKKIKQIDFHKVLKLDPKTNYYDTSEIEKFYVLTDDK